MTPRTLAVVGALFLLPAALMAQATPQTPVVATPGPATARPQVPPRDGTVGAMRTGTGRIRGRVTAADTGAPIRRAQVRVSGASPGLQQVADTDADGRYEFLNVPASSYRISVTRVGYIGREFGQATQSQPGKSFSVAEGEAVDKIDVALPRGAVIAGRILDDVGEPVPGVRVQAQRYSYQPGGERRLITVGYQMITDDLGQFRVYGLVPGSYLVSADQNANTYFYNGDAPTSITANSSVNGTDGFTTTYFPGTANADDAQVVSVTVGQEANVSFALASVRLSRISGVIRNSQGSSVGRAPVILVRRNGSGYMTTGNVSSQPDGSFTLTRVPPGELSIEVRPITSSMASAIGLTPTDEFASVPVSVAGQDVTGLVITTGSGAVISGRLVFEGNPPPPAQGPAQRLRVYANSADPYTPVAGIPPEDNGLVDETGHFQIRGVAGRLLFRPSGPGWSLKSVTLNGVDITDTPFEAKPSSNTTGLEVTVTTRLTTLAGVVSTARGDALGGSVVIVFPAAPKEGQGAARFTRTLRPDQEGKYQLKGLPPGDYVAVAVQSFEPGTEWDPAFQQQMKPRGKAFHLTEGQSTTLDLSLLP